MTGAVLNFYGYMSEGKYKVHYGIGGSFFFIKPDTALTANHVLNKDFFSTTGDFLNKQSFFIGENNFIVEVYADLLFEHKNIDLTVIKFPNDVSSTFFDVSQDEPTVNQEFYSIGFIAGEQPEIHTKNNSYKVILEKVLLNDLTKIKQVGYVKKLLCKTLKSADLNINNVNTIETSFGGYLGMSGGPLIDKSTQKIIGILSHGDPDDNDIKDVLYATDCTEIIKVI